MLPPTEWIKFKKRLMELFEEALREGIIFTKAEMEEAEEYYERIWMTASGEDGNAWYDSRQRFGIPAGVWMAISRHIDINGRIKHFDIVPSIDFLHTPDGGVRDYGYTFSCR